MAGCTIVSPNYLPFARTLAQSYLRHHPSHRFFVLVVARDAAKAKAPECFETIALQEIGVPDLQGATFRFEILELNTNVKPTFLKYLLRTFDLDAVFYLDPDIKVFRELKPILEAAERGSIVITPHITSPIEDDKQPSEVDFLMAGTYNLGFIGVRNGDGGMRFLDWWEQRCLTLGFSEGRSGLFVDQKWINLVPGMFEGVQICRDVGCNVAYWNLHERTLSKGAGPQWMVNGSTPVSFFHFSGIGLSDSPTISKHTNRFDLNTRGDLAELFREYRAEVISNKKPEIDDVPYGFDHFSDGTAVTQFSRRVFASRESEFAGDPFDAEGQFYKEAKRVGLIDRKTSEPRLSWRDYNANDWRVRVVNKGLRQLLRVLGPQRYSMLMKYLGFATILRNQGQFLR